MLFLLIAAIGIFALIITLIAKSSNNAKLLGLVVKKKNEESDDEYLARAFKNALLLSIGLTVIGLVGYFL